MKKRLYSEAQLNHYIREISPSKRQNTGSGEKNSESEFIITDDVSEFMENIL
jgi:hypothetical protein